jgi:hypothetical protein
MKEIELVLCLNSTNQLGPHYKSINQTEIENQISID